MNDLTKDIISDTDSNFMEITKEMIEKSLGYEINWFKLEPVYLDGKCIGLNINVEPKKEVEFINVSVTIDKSDYFKQQDYWYIFN